MKKEFDYEINHIKVLDGIRALAIIIIVWYHFWQQSWVGITFINIEFLYRFGYLFVDMLILLSSFCLFLPYARSMIYGEKVPNTKEFYINRMARIVPSYLISMIIAIIFIVILKTKINPIFFIKDTVTHLTFTHNLFKDTLLFSNYIGVLWTLGVEVQFYLVFPFLAKRFIKKPVLTYIIMLLIGFGFTMLIKSMITEQNISFFVNHTLTFIPIYANGMLGAWLYVKYTKNKKRSVTKGLLFTILSIICIYVYSRICKSFGPTIIDLQYWQINYRFLLSCLFLVFIISTIASSKIYRFLYENRLMKFIAIISFNLYIYHHFIAVKLKEFRIPYWEGGVPPNITGDIKWQWTYFIYCIITSIFIAAVMTYFVEKPSAKWIKNKFLNKKDIKKQK